MAKESAQSGEELGERGGRYMTFAGWCSELRTGLLKRRKM